jgi:DNA recombination protein RmuC
MNFSPDPAVAFAAIAGVLALAALVAVLLQSAALHRLRLLAEQALAGQRSEADTLRSALAVNGSQLRQEVAAGLAEMRTSMDARLRELREGNDARLDAIRRTVDEQLHAAVEKQMTASFARVADQFTALQKAMGDVAAVTGQIGDLKRLFGNIKTRGGWGETQLRAMLDDILPAGSYETNWRPRPESADAVEFAVIMPTGGANRPRLPIDAKFPVEDYERLLTAAEAGDAEAERAARRALERRVRDEARKIAGKYIAAPATVEFAVMYVPTDGLYTEIARIPGLIDALGREFHVLVLGPALFPALLRTIHLGHVTLALEQKAGEIGRLLGATRTEMAKMDDLLDRLLKQAGAFTGTIELARVRTRAVGRKLREVAVLDPDEAVTLLGIDDAAS